MRIIHCAPFATYTKIGLSLYTIPIKLSMGFIQNNHFVHNFDYRDTARYLSIFRNKKYGQKKMNEFFKEVVDSLRPDLVILGHAEMIYVDTLEYIKKQGVKIAYWFNDVPLADEFYEFAPYLDLAFATAGGEFVEDMQKKVSRSFFMPNPADVNCEKYRSFENEIFKYDVSMFTRKDSSRVELFEFVNNKMDKNIKKLICGETRDSVIMGDDYLRVLRDSKIVINPNRGRGHKYRWYTSDRLMHILGNGSFTITTPILDSEKFFEDKLQSFNNIEELEQKIEYFLKNDKERRDLSKWLWTRTHQLFNAKKVSKYVLDALDEKDLKEYEWSV